MKYIQHSFSVMKISNILKSVEEEDEIKIDWIMIKKFLNVLSV